MYGGHITDDWDRRLCVSYLEELMQPELIDGELMLAPGKRFICSFILIQYNPNVTRVENHRRFPSAAQHGFSRVSRVHRRGDAPRITLPVRVASKRGNRLLDHDRGKFVQNGVRDATEGRGQLRQSNGDQRGKGNFDRTSERRGEKRLFRMDVWEKVKQMLDEIMEKLPEEFNMVEIMGKVEERTPYVIVAFQECERMNHLTTEIKRSLRELDLGLKGELTITSDMEDLENALFLDQVPLVWANRAYPSLLGLAAWFVDLLLRIRELDTWSTDFVVRRDKITILIFDNNFVSSILSLRRFQLRRIIYFTMIMCDDIIYKKKLLENNLIFTDDRDIIYDTKLSNLDMDTYNH